MKLFFVFGIFLMIDNSYAANGCRLSVNTSGNVMISQDMQSGSSFSYTANNGNCVTATCSSGTITYSNNYGNHGGDCPQGFGAINGSAGRPSMRVKK